MRTVPMIFNTEMVKALLDGRKTVTRRPIKMPAGWLVSDRGLATITSSHPKKGKWGVLIENLSDPSFPRHDLTVSPSMPGNLIWVKETFANLHNGTYEELLINDRSCNELRYKASEPESLAEGSDWEIRGYKWRPSIHMPRWASRLTLKVTNVRIEQINDLRKNEEQVQKEGFENFPRFKHVWRSSYGECRPEQWVWVIEFEVIHQNIDSILSKQAA